MTTSIKSVMHIILLGVIVAVIMSPLVHASKYSLKDAMIKAQTEDPWLQGNYHEQQHHVAQSIILSSLPDPVISLGLANMPVDSFDFSDENMTQLKIGVSQTFPRGETLSLRKQKFQKLSEGQPYKREDRKAKISIITAHLWLDAFRYQSAIDLIKQDRSLFEYLVDVTHSNYTSANGRTRQQDLIRAQLELTRLEDRLTTLKMHYDKNIAQLSVILDDPFVSLDTDFDVGGESLYDSLKAHIDSLNSHSSEQLQQHISSILIQHPSILSIDKKILASDADVRIAEQGYKPQWGINASYAYRDDMPTGEDRADLFSVGVSLNMPIFTRTPQDEGVKSAKSQFHASQVERDLALRTMKSNFQQFLIIYMRLQQRQSLFNTDILEDMSEQAEASLTAYTNDDGDFSEVIRARIAELNTSIEALNINLELYKTMAELKYFYAGTDEFYDSQISPNLTHR